MRVFAISDVHVDYEANRRWLQQLSRYDFTRDVLLVAGDMTDSLTLLRDSLAPLARAFLHVVFVPGNHDIWVLRDPPTLDSFGKYGQVRQVAIECGIEVDTLVVDCLRIVPLLSWYDYSFGSPGPELTAWMDYRACRWPPGFDGASITSRFLEMNDIGPDAAATHAEAPRETISISHFLPRVDLMPDFIPANRRFLYPVLGTARLDAQVRALGSRLHVYGHSHVNRDVVIDGVRYVNNAFAYPHETAIAAKRLVCVHEC